MGALLVGPCAPGWSHWEPEELFLQKAMRRSKELGGPGLKLLRTAAPAVGPSRALLTIFPSSEEISSITVDHMEAVENWAPLGWRHEQDGDPARAHHGHGHAAGSRPWPRQLQTLGHEPVALGARCRFWRARVTVEDPRGGARTEWCLLQVATRVEDRTPEVVSQDIKDAAALAKHADAFNKGVLACGSMGADESMTAVDDSVPQVCVTMPTGCRIVESPVPQHLVPGDEVVLLPYTALEVTKFVYDGEESYLELPQAFFHYVLWASGGEGCVTDLQGVEEDDGSVVLVRPCPLRRATPASSGALGTLGVLGALEDGDDEAMDLFDRVHPRCGPLCKVFDPQRRARSTRRHCGLDVRGCGIRQL